MNPSQMSYRNAEESDLPFLLKLRKDSMEPHLIQAGIPVSEEEHLKRIQYKFHAALIILLNGEEIGLLKAVENHDYIEIIQFQILSSFRGKGLGKKVLAYLKERAERKKVYLSLSVLKANPARALYEKMGFKVIAETEDSYVMETARGNAE